MDDQKVLSNLRRENPWWSEKEIDLDENFYRRSHFYILKEEIHEEEITGILGPRRVGKTTTIRQIAEYLFKEEEVNPKNIFYVQLDNPYLNNSLDNPLEEVLEVYQDYVLEESFENLENEVYIFLDEIQELDNWAEKLKHWYGLDYDIIFVISGSSSSQITAGSESLLGRILEKKMLPLKFSETINMKRKCDELELNFDFRRNKYVMKNAFEKAIEDNSPKDLKAAFVKNQSFLKTDKPKIQSELERYFKRGGFPRIIKREIEEGVDMDYASKKLESDAEKAVRKDASELYEVNPDNLMKVMLFIADNTAQKIVEKNVAEFVGVSPPTAGNYIEYLEEAYLIHRTKFYSGSTAASERKQRKGYIWDPGFRNAVAGSLGGDYELTPDEKGLVVESICADHLKRLCFNLGGLENTVYYWDDNRSEVDLVINYDDKTLPIEVKYRNDFDNSDIKGLNRFLYDHNEIDFGIVITKDKSGIKTLDNGKAVLLPLWNLLMMI